MKGFDGGFFDGYLSGDFGVQALALYPGVFGDVDIDVGGQRPDVLPPRGMRFA